MNVNQESTEESIEPIIPLLRTKAASEIEEAKKNTTTSPFGSIFVLINAALGGGLLAFPYAFWSSGGVAIALILEAVSKYLTCKHLSVVFLYKPLKPSVTTQALLAFTSLTK